MRTGVARKAHHRRFLVAMSALLTVFLLFLGVAQAFANPIGGGIGTPGETTEETGNSGTPGSSGGGGGYDQYQYWSATNTLRIPARCAATLNNGEFIGQRLTLRFPKGMSLMTADAAFRAGNTTSGVTGTYRCLYEAQYVTKTVTCVTSLDAGLAMTTPRKESLGNVPYTSKFKSSQKLADCEDGNREVAIKKNVTDFGRYQFTGTATVQDCSYRHYIAANMKTGAWKADEIESCSSPRPKPPVVKKWQLDCTGFHTSWFGSPVWDANDCKTNKDPKKGEWVCTAPTDNKINGQVTNKATLFRDGENNPVVFGTSKPKGKGIVSINKTDTRLLRDAASTPWVKGKNSAANSFGILNGKKNVLSTETKTSWIAGNKPTVSIFGLMESSQDKPTKLTAEYRFGMTVQAERVRITGVNMKTGQPTIERTIVNKKTTGTCFSKPASVQFVRGVVSQ